MESFISTFVIILPGVMAYFWLQLFGLTQPIKHSAPEFTGIAALLWLPISGVTLMLLNLWSALIGNVNAAWTITELKTVTLDFRYLLLFMGLSAIVSFILCGLWVYAGSRYNLRAVNWMRSKIGLATKSNSVSSWEKFFIVYDKKKEKEKQMVLQISKIDKQEEYIVGSPSNISEVNETDRGLILEKVDEWSKALEHSEYKIKRVFVDVKSGLVFKELDPNESSPTIKSSKKKKK